MACDPRFVILSSPRTGSHFLATSLDAHPALCVAGEITYRGEDYGLDPCVTVPARQFVDQAFERWNGFIQHRNPGAYQSGLTKVSLWGELLRDPQLRIINLKRHNLLASISSLAVAVSSGVFQVEAADSTSAIVDADRDAWCARKAPDTRVRLAPTYIGYRVRELLDEYAEFDRVIPAGQRLDLWYEDLVADYHGSCDRLQDYLGLERWPLQPSTEKQERRPLHDVIENFEQAQQLVNLLTPLSWKNLRKE